MDALGRKALSTLALDEILKGLTGALTLDVARKQALGDLAHGAAFLRRPSQRQVGCLKVPRRPQYVSFSSADRSLANLRERKALSSDRSRSLLMSRSAAISGTSLPSSASSTAWTRIRRYSDFVFSYYPCCLGSGPEISHASEHVNGDLRACGLFSSVFDQFKEQISFRSRPNFCFLLAARLDLG